MAQVHACPQRHLVTAYVALFYENDCKLAILDTERVGMIVNTSQCY